MEKELRILVLDDDENDASLAAHALSEGKLAFNMVRVETEAAFRNQLEHDHPDVILSDHGLPTFDGLSALAVARTKCPDTPFILVCGAKRDQMVITALQEGATGCVPKDQLSTLAATVKHAVDFAEESARWRATEAELKRQIQDLQEELNTVKTLTGFIHVCANCKRIKDEEGVWTLMERYLAAHSDASFSHGICPECAQKIYADLLPLT